MKKRYRIASKARFTAFVTILILCITLACGTLLGFHTVNSASRDCYRQVRVETGDTLWDIAVAYGPSQTDVRQTVYEICDLNDLRADELQAGQKILVPVYE